MKWCPRTEEITSPGEYRLRFDEDGPFLQCTAVLKDGKDRLEGLIPMGASGLSRMRIESMVGATQEFSLA